jgi:hypothetical protein
MPYLLLIRDGRPSHLDLPARSHKGFGTAGHTHEHVLLVRPPANFKFLSGPTNSRGTAST